MQLWVGDYLGDTRHFTTEQHGAYLLLLFSMWRTETGDLPADDAKLARIAGLTLKRWNATKGDIMAKMTIEDGRVYQKRLRAELQKAVAKSESRSLAGKRGGDAKALKENKPTVAIASVLSQHYSEPEPKPEAVAAAHDAQSNSDQLNRLGRIMNFDERNYTAFAANLRTLIALKTEGCDFEAHIRPAAEAAARGGRQVGSLAYIVPKARELRDAAKLVENIPPPFENTDERGWRDRLRLFRADGRWHPKWGAKPGEPGCKCPAEILAEKSEAA